MERRYALAGWWLVLLLAGCALSGAGGGAATQVDPQAAAFQQIVTELASPEMEGRGAGYEGLDRARDYLVSGFREAGLAPAFVGPEGERRYVQPVEIDLGVRATKAVLQLAHDGETVTFDPGPGGDFNVLGFSGDGAFAGEPVFVGYGIVAPERDYDSYAGLAADALRGKVAIAYRYEPMDDEQRSLWARGEGRQWTEAASLTNKADWAAERGAVALLVVDPPAMDRGGPLRATAQTAFGEPAPIPVMHVRGTTFRRILEAADRANAMRAMRVYQQRADAGTLRPDALEGVRLAGEVELERPTAIVHNVAGLIPGEGELADEVVIVGAHYDHLGYGEIGSFVEEATLHPGADDNASGTAGLILLARHFAEQVEAPRDGNDPTPDARRTLLFIGFSGEERGLLGSNYLVNHPEQLVVGLDDALAMLNMDMIGRLREVLWVFGTDTAAEWPALLEQAKTDIGLDTALRSTGSGLGMSDHTPFYLKRIPVLHFFTGVHADYHRPTDTADKINAEGGAKVVALVAELIEPLLHRPDPLTFQVTERDPHAGAQLSGDGAYLGVMPDYATLEGHDGAGLTAVTPGSPAERAGLEAGDVIVRWNGEPVANVRALTERLAESEPGETVTLHVRRDGQVLEQQVTLGQR